jgi:hypothetical protein
MWLGDELSEHHPIIGRRLIPGIRCVLHHPEWGDHLIESNQHGFRSMHEYVREKQPGRFRILLFGDSNAFGDGVSPEISFAGALETLLPNVEVYNFAMAGFALDQQYICYQEFCANMEYDLVLIAPTIETIRKISAHYILAQDKDRILRCLEKPYFDLVDGHLTRHHVPLKETYVDVDHLPPHEKERVYRANPFADIRRLLDATRPIPKLKKKFHIMDFLRSFLKKMRVKDVITQVRPYPEYDNPNTHAWRISQAILNEWTAACPVPLMLAPLPSFIYVKERADARNYQMRFREVETLTGCLRYDPLPDLLRLPMDERRDLYYMEGHLTPKGHAWFAKRLVPHIKSLMKKRKG